MPWTRGLGGLAPFCNFRTALRAATSYCGSCMEAPSLATSHLTSTRRKSATFDLASRGSVLSARSNNFSGAHTDSSGCVQGTRDPPIESICPFFHQFGFGPKYAPKRWIPPESSANMSSWNAERCRPEKKEVVITRCSGRPHSEAWRSPGFHGRPVNPYIF